MGGWGCVSRFFAGGAAFHTGNCGGGADWLGVGAGQAWSTGRWHGIRGLIRLLISSAATGENGVFVVGADRFVSDD